MDCFYAAIEVRDHPHLRGEPVAVGGPSARRGVLTTCNYEARQYGIRSAMPTFQAMRLCPHLVLMPVRFEAYRQESRRIRQIFERYTAAIEPLSLDEAYLDVSRLSRPGAEIAQEIRDKIRQATGLRASAGIAPNKMLAKIASDWNKPNGQFEIKPHEIESFMSQLPVSKIWGVGKKTLALLEAHGIKSCVELQQRDKLSLQRLFGKFGSELFELCRGIDHRPVIANRIRKSMGCERTFANDLSALEEWQENAADIYRELQADLAKMKTPRDIAKIFLKLKYHDFKQASIERSGLEPTLANYHALIEQAFQARPEPVRLLGLGVRFTPPADAFPQQLEFRLAEEDA